MLQRTTGPNPPLFGVMSALYVSQRPIAALGAYFGRWSTLLVERRMRDCPPTAERGPERPTT
jgi:hypothetical protein